MDEDESSGAQSRYTWCAVGERIIWTSDQYSLTGVSEGVPSRIMDQI